MKGRKKKNRTNNKKKKTNSVHVHRLLRVQHNGRVSKKDKAGWSLGPELEAAQQPPATEFRSPADSGRRGRGAKKPVEEFLVTADPCGA
jgi:hypothetical protein